MYLCLPLSHSLPRDPFFPPLPFAMDSGQNDQNRSLIMTYSTSGCTWEEQNKVCSYRGCSGNYIFDVGVDGYPKTSKSEYIVLCSINTNNILQMLSVWKSIFHSILFILSMQKYSRNKIVWHHSQWTIRFFQGFVYFDKDLRTLLVAVGCNSL